MLINLSRFLRLYTLDSSRVNVLSYSEFGFKFQMVFGKDSFASNLSLIYPMDRFTILVICYPCRGFSSQFPVKIHHICTDRHTANMKCEKMRQAKKPDTVKAHYTCDVHKLFSATKYSMDHVTTDVSGLLSLGISHQGNAGMVHLIWSVLAEIIQEDLVVTYGTPEPAHAKHREALFSVFLPTHRGHPCRKTNFKRRFILHHILNGDWQSDHLHHVCQYGCCVDFADCMWKVKKFLLWALAPTKCPKFCRSRWTRYDLSIDWAGLLGNICNGKILAKLVSKTSGNPTKSPAATVSEQRDAIQDSDTVAQWLQLAGDELGMQLVPRDHDAEVQAEPPPSNVARDSSGFDWVKFNEQNKASALEWSASNPGIRLIIMKVVATPMLAIMQKFLQISSPKWERMQAAKAACGQQRSYRVLEGALGKDIAHCMDVLLGSTRQAPEALPLSGMRRCMRTLHFRMVASAMASLHAYLRVERQGLRFQWFKVLLQQREEIEQVYLQPHCMADELTTELLKMFPTAEAACTPECQTLAAFLGCALFTDIAKVEARHSSNREVTFARARGWPVDISEMNAKFVCRQYVSKTQKVTKERKRPGPRPKKIKRKNTKGGGAWRAYIHHRYKGIKFSRESMRQISAEYRNLSPNEKAFYRDVGSQATESHRHGFSSFAGQRRSQTMGSSAKTASNTSPGDITETGAIVAADSNMPDLFLDAYGGPNFEDAFDQAKQQLVQQDALARRSEEKVDSINDQSIVEYVANNPLDENLPCFGDSLSVLPSSIAGCARLAWQPKLQGFVEALIV